MSTRLSRATRLMGLITAGFGFAHFVEPRLFGPVTTIAFPDHTRTHVYVNGGAEAAIGLLVSRPSTRELGVVALVAYAVYLTGHAIRSVRTHAARHLPQHTRTLRA